MSCESASGPMWIATSCRVERDKVLRDPSDQSLLLRFGKLAGAAADLEACQAADPALAVNLMPVANRLVVQQQSLSDLDTTPTLVEKQHRIGSSRQSMRRRSVPRQSAQGRAIFLRQKTRANHAANPNPILLAWQPLPDKLFACSMSQGI